MALAHQILESVHWPAVTNARANGEPPLNTMTNMQPEEGHRSVIEKSHVALVAGDGGLDVASLPLTGLLAATVGLGWSKDNLRTADKCYVNGTFPNGTVE